MSSSDVSDAVSPDERSIQSVLVTPEQLEAQPWPADAVVVVVSDDCIKAVDATREAQGRYGVFIGEESDPALDEMREELYDSPRS